MKVIGCRGTVGAGILLAALLGCGASDEPADTTDSDVKEEVGGVAEDVDSYAVTERRELEQRAQQALDEADRALEDAQTRLSELPVVARQRLDAAIDHTQRARDSVAKELAELKIADAERWESTQQRLSDALDEMAEARLEIRVAQSEG
jgi:DNA anti-recombination protein RmuC